MLVHGERGPVPVHVCVCVCVCVRAGAAVETGDEQVSRSILKSLRTKDYILFIIFVRTDEAPTRLGLRNIHCSVLPTAADRSLSLFGLCG